MTTPTRPLTPLERAILRAVVELGDDAYGVPVHEMVVTRWGWPTIPAMYYTLHRLEEEGFLKSWVVEGDFPERGGLPRRYWKPAFDLTEVLKEP